jgi:hypothetical protein
MTIPWENVLAGLGPDLENESPLAPECSSREFDLSTFAPPPVATPPLDYDNIMAELDRLLLVIDDLKIAAGSIVA